MIWKAPDIIINKYFMVGLKSSLCFILSLPIFCHGSLPAGDISSDMTARRFSLGLIPVAAYDSDLGIKYGAVVNIFDYRNKIIQNRYDQHLFLRFTNTTMGSLQIQGLLESNVLIRKSVTIIEASYLSDKKYDFYGFNGLESVYRPELTKPTHTQFINRFYYSYERALLRLRFDNQLKLGNNGFRLLTGAMLNNYRISFAENNTEGSPTQNPGNSSLYSNYAEWEIVKESEKSGGWINTLSIGLIYDTRNDLCYCTNGIWAESVLLHSPGIINENPFTRLVLTYRQHTSFLRDKLTVSFRVSNQNHLGSSPPFYSLSTYYDSRLSQDGIGGAFNLRGANRNRIVSKGFLISNIEPKVKIWEFSLFRKDFFISTSLFYDNALVTQEYRQNLRNVPEDLEQLYFRDKGQRFHHSAGAGAYIVFNKDNVITINYGKPFNKHDGNGGLYVGSSLLF